MYINDSVKILYLITYLSYVFYICDGSFCNVPNNCVALLDCPVIVKMMRGNLSVEQRGFIRDSVCSETTRKMCCPIDLHLPKPTECGIYYGVYDKIVGGKNTNLEEFPWTVLLKRKDDTFENHLCAGSLINKRYVVTAAHCFKRRKEATTEIEYFEVESVLLGEWNKTSDIDCINGKCGDRPVEINVEKLIIYEKYIPNTSAEDDIALIRLANEVEYTEYIKPICLPLSENLKNELFDDSTTFTVVGWGKTENSISTSDVKKKANIPSFNHDRCVNLYWSMYKTDIVDKQICAGGERNINSCRGDSGGPLMALNMENRFNPRHYLAGIVSFGPQACAIPGTPNIYTRVGAYIDWILKNIEP